MNWIAKVHDILEMWQGSENLHDAQLESHAQNWQMGAREYISNTEEIVKESWSNFQPEGVAASKLSERSPVPPPPVSATYLPRGWNPVYNACRIKRFDRHPTDNDEDSTTESILDTENLHDCNGALDNPDVSEDKQEADNESNIELENSVDNPATPEQGDVGVALSVARLIWPTWRSMKKGEKMLLTANTMETKRYNWNKKK